MEGRDAEDYDRLVATSSSGHFAQTRAWAKVAKRARPCAPRFFLARDGERAIGAALVVRSSLGPLMLPFAEVERGPVCADRADVPRVADALARRARMLGVARLAIMPYWTGEAARLVERDLGEVRFCVAQEPDGPHAATLRLPLTGRPLEAVLAGSERAQLRRLWREAVAAGATAEIGGRESFDAHRRLVAQRIAAVGGRERSGRWHDELWRWIALGGGAVFACRYQGRIVGTAVVLRHTRLAVYAHGATEPGHSPISKSVLPLVEAIRWAIAAGCEHFDLGGVPLADDTDDKRLAIARFKLHFDKSVLPLVRRHARWL